MDAYRLEPETVADIERFAKAVEAETQRNIDWDALIEKIKGCAEVSISYEIEWDNDRLKQVLSDGSIFHP